MTDDYFRDNFFKIKKVPSFSKPNKKFDKITKIITVLYIFFNLRSCHFKRVVCFNQKQEKSDKTLSCIHLHILTYQWYDNIIFIFINIR